jgi:hypothetical protein
MKIKDQKVQKVIYLKMREINMLIIIIILVLENMIMEILIV